MSKKTPEMMSRCNDIVFDTVMDIAGEGRTRKVRQTEKINRIFKSRKKRREALFQEAWDRLKKQKVGPGGTVTNALDPEKGGITYAEVIEIIRDEVCKPSD